MVTGTGSVARDTDDHALSTYLERHLSGSDVAVRLVDGLLGRASDQEERDFLERFSRELEDERAVLHSIIDGLDHDQGLVQRGMGIATGVAAMAKAALPGSPDELEALEALAVGVWGKRLLWGALQTVADRTSVSMDCRSVLWRAKPRTRNGSWSACGSGPSPPRYCADHERGRAMSGGDDP